VPSLAEIDAEIAERVRALNPAQGPAPLDVVGGPAPAAQPTLSPAEGPVAVQQFIPVQGAVPAQAQAQSPPTLDQIDAAIAAKGGAAQAAADRAAAREPLMTEREMFTGAGRIAQLPERFQDAKEVSEILFTGEFPEDTSFLDQLKLGAGILTSVDPEGQIDVLKEFFPDAEVVTGRGTTMITIGDQPLLLNRPGLSAADRTQLMVQALAFIPAVKWASLAKTLGTRIMRQGLGAFGTSVVLDKAAQDLGSDQPVSLGRAALAGAGASIGEAAPLLAAAGRKVGARRATKQAAQDAEQLRVETTEFEKIRPEVERGEELAEQFGPLLVAQKKPSDLFEAERQAFLASHPKVAIDAVEVLQAQNKDAGEAVISFMNDLSTVKEAADSADAVFAAAEIARGALDQSRAAVSSPIYKRAWQDARRAGTQVDIDGVAARLKFKLTHEHTSGDVHNALKTAMANIKKSADSPRSNLRTLHGARETLFQQMAQARKDGARTTSRELSGVWADLTDAMNEASPRYAAATKAYREASPALDAFEKTPVAAIADLDKVDFNAIRRLTFANPRSVAQVKKAVNAADPSGDSWNALARENIRWRVDKARVPGIIEEATEEERKILLAGNEPALLRRLLYGKGTEDRRVLLDSVDGEMRKNLVAFEEWLGRAAIGRPGGSQTGIRRVIEKEFRGPFVALREFVMSPKQGAAEAIDTTAYNRGVETAAKILFDPDWTPDLSAVRQIKDPNKAQQAMKKLLDAASKPEVRTAVAATAASAARSSEEIPDEEVPQ